MKYAEEFVSQTTSTTVDFFSKPTHKINLCIKTNYNQLKSTVRLLDRGAGLNIVDETILQMKWLTKTKSRKPPKIAYRNKVNSGAFVHIPCVRMLRILKPQHLVLSSWKLGCQCFARDHVHRPVCLRDVLKNENGVVWHLKLSSTLLRNSGMKKSFSIFTNRKAMTHPTRLLYGLHNTRFKPSQRSKC